MMKRKGIILAGGAGTRLYPLTKAISKQLLPVFDKPLIFYPLTTLISANIREILIISDPHNLPLIKAFLGSGASWNMKFEYAIQENPNGIAESFILGEKFLNGSPSCLVLGDNIFYGSDVTQSVIKASKSKGNTLFTYKVRDPERFGVVKYDKNNNLQSIVEKPKKFVSSDAVTGLYFYDADATKFAKQLKKSKRGELEITDLNNLYLKQGKKVYISKLGKGSIWMDCGTPTSLIEAANYVEMFEKHQNIKIGCPEESLFRKTILSKKELKKIVSEMPKNQYSDYLRNIIDGK